jgi:hypothetical protein
MSIFSKIKDVVKSGAEKVLKIVSIANPTQINPIQKVREVVELVTNKKIEKSKAEKKINVAIAVPVGAIAGGLLAGPKGALIGATALPTITALTETSEKSSKFISTQLTNFLTGETQEQVGSTLGEFIEGGETEPDWYKTARMLGLGAGISVLIAGGAYLGYKLINGKLKKSESETIIPQDEQTGKPIDTGETLATSKETDMGIPTEAPQRETTSITKKRYKRSKTKKLTSVNQKVNILINNRPSAVGIANKRYIKEVAYA